MDVQRLADCLGDESLNVKPQVFNGGRKILTLNKGLEIVCTLGNASGYLYDISIRNNATYRKQKYV